MTNTANRQARDAPVGTGASVPGTARPALRAMTAGLVLTVLGTVWTVVRTDALVAHLHDVYDGWTGPDAVGAAQAGLVSYLYLIAALGVAGWLVCAWAVRRGKRWTRWLSTTLFVLGTVVAVPNLVVREYGQPILTADLGVAGVLPCVAGLVAVVLLWRRGGSRA